MGRKFVLCAGEGLARAKNLFYVQSRGSLGLKIRFMRGIIMRRLRNYLIFALNSFGVTPVFFLNLVEK